MKNSLLLCTLLFLSTVISAQKVINDPNVQVRPVSGFHAVHVSSAFDVILTQGGEEQVAVSANKEEFLPNIKTEVRNGVLRIYYEDDRKAWQKGPKLKAYVSVKNIDELKASGATDIRIEGTLTASKLILDFSGASDLAGRLVVNGPLSINLSGASDLEISGSATDVQIDAKGASDIKAYDFSVRNCTVEAAGATTVRLTINGELSAKASGASNISYQGSAVIREIKTSGASNISRKS